MIVLFRVLEDTIPKEMKIVASSIKQPNLSSTRGSSHFEYLGNDLKLVSPVLNLIVQYNVKLHPNKGELNPSKDITEYDFGYDMILPTPPDIDMKDKNYEGFSFAGWFEGGGILTSVIKAGEMGDKEFWAKWAKIESDDQANKYILFNNDKNEVVKLASSNFKIITISPPTSSGGSSARTWTVNFTKGNSNGKVKGTLTQGTSVITSGAKGYILKEDVTYTYGDIDAKADEFKIVALQNTAGKDQKVNYTINILVPIKDLLVFKEH